MNVVDVVTNAFRRSGQSDMGALILVSKQQQVTNAFRRSGQSDKLAGSAEWQQWLSPMPFGGAVRATPHLPQTSSPRSTRHQCLSAERSERHVPPGTSTSRTPVTNAFRRSGQSDNLYVQISNSHGSSPMPFGGAVRATKETAMNESIDDCHQCLSAERSERQSR